MKQLKILYFVRFLYFLRCLQYICTKSVLTYKLCINNWCKNYNEHKKSGDISGVFQIPRLQHVLYI